MTSFTARRAQGISMNVRSLLKITGITSRIIAAVVVPCCMMMTGSVAVAQTTWTWSGGGGDGNWANGANWTYNTGTVADPLTTQALVFQGATQLATTNNTAAGGTTSRIQFNAGAGAFTLSGNALTLSGNLQNSATGNTQTISLPLNLTAATHTFTLSSGGTTAITSSITGGNTAGNSTISGTLGGVLWLSGSNSFTGNVTLNGANLLLGHANALSSGTLRLLSGAAAPNVAASADLLLANNVLLNTGTATFSGGNSLGFAELVQQGGNRQLTNTLAAGKSLTFSGTTYLQESGTGVGRTLTLAGTGNTVFNGAIVNGGTAGSGGLTITNTGTTTLGATNTFSGQTTIAAGVVSLPSPNGLLNTSKIRVLDTAKLDYTGAAATISRTISSGTIVGGTATVSNSGGGLLTLSGGVEVNGATMRFAGGQFDATGLMSGTNGLGVVVDGASLTISNTSTYAGPTAVRNGGTLVLGTSAAIPSASAVSIDAATLTVGSRSNTIASLTTAGNATLGFAINGGSSGSLSMTNLSLGGGSNTLAITMTSPTAGIYNLLTYSGNKTGSVTATGLDSNYTLLQGAASNGAIAVQRRAEFGTVSASPAAATIITGGSTAISYTAANITPAGGAALSFASANGSNVSGASSGSALASSTSSTISSLFFTGTAIGASQTGSFMLADAAAIGSGTGSVSVTVLDHATSSLAATLLTGTTISLGTYNYATGQWEVGSGTGLFSIFNLASSAGSSLTADLSLVGVSGGATGYSTNLGTYTNIAGGDTRQYSITFDPTGLTLASGTQSATFQLSMEDQTGLSGALATNTLSVTANVVVVPEPGALALAGLGVGVAGWMARIRRRGSRKI